MINSIEQIKKDINYESEDLIDVDYSKLDKGWEYWDIADKISWVYKDEVDFHIKVNDLKDKNDFDIWMRHGNGPYTGVLFTFEDKIFRMAENAVVCCYDYPIEKENCSTFWVSLDRLLISPDLYKIYKI